MEEAYQAYGSKDKCEHLLREQENGICILKSKNNVYVLQHSKLQRKYLIDKGVKEEIIKEINPPIICKNISNAKLNQDLKEFLFLNKNSIILCSNVARIDYFKNIDLLISSSLKLLQEGVPIKVVITGGTKLDFKKRQDLRNLIPTQLRTKFLIIEKLHQDELHLLFNIIKSRSIFVCTSRYETLGITPLEAGVSGVCTIVPKLDSVEVSRYFPDKYKYEYNVISLTNKIYNLYRSEAYSKKQTDRYLSKQISDKLFKKSFINSWEYISTMTTMKDIDRYNYIESVTY
ncbi:glycosyltransferase [Lachnotalea glycerini]|uniref:Glycosyltransferase family 1 protein n=1 Tax=Lachnotalea glycerini TaxID=1763509 RepID=A0A371JCD9_9FIRM|nr:glycosyltransferase [Lachnotalea glycerini]RDY30411.1 glycosyltransferase family 1 protein [Lachnotalea glycerini]